MNNIIIAKESARSKTLSQQIDKEIERIKQPNKNRKNKEQKNGKRDRAQ